MVLAAGFSRGFPMLRTTSICREKILVNKSDKSDHPHQWEPWCLVEVVNKIGAGAMAISWFSYGPGATIRSFINP